MHSDGQGRGVFCFYQVWCLIAFIKSRLSCPLVMLGETYIMQVNKMNKCWICSAEANSSEHKIKRKDFIKLWGKGPYKGDSAIAHFKNGKQTLIHGPNSKKIKFDNNLCNKCNNSITQPFDLAYDKFIDWFDSNNEYVYQKRVIDWQTVYGDEFVEKQTNLFKYFAKCLGCRILDYGNEVPKDLIDLFSKKQFETGLKVSFCINEDMALLPDEDLGLGINPLYIDKSPFQDIPAYYCGHSYKWLDMNYFYLFAYDNSLGASWVADSRYVYIGYYYPSTLEEREELKKKIRNRNA